MTTATWILITFGGAYFLGEKKFAHCIVFIFAIVLLRGVGGDVQPTHTLLAQQFKGDATIYDEEHLSDVLDTHLYQAVHYKAANTNPIPGFGSIHRPLAKLVTRHAETIEQANTDSLQSHSH